MAENRTIVVFAAVVQAGVALALVQSGSFGAAVFWAGLLGGIVVALVSEAGDDHLRDGFLTGMFATVLVVAGFYLFLDGLAIETALDRPERHVVIENGRTVGVVLRDTSPWFQGASILVGFVTAPLFGLANGVSAVLVRPLGSRIDAFRQGMRDAR